MSYFPDLSPYTYGKYIPDCGAVNVGWLDVGYDYPQGDVPPEFVERLWALCGLPVHMSRGIDNCHLCRTLHEVLLVERAGESLVPGSAEIRAFGSDGAIYAARYDLPLRHGAPLSAPRFIH